MILGIIIFVVLALSFGLVINSFLSLGKQDKRTVMKYAGIGTAYFVVCSILSLIILLSIVQFF